MENDGPEQEDTGQPETPHIRACSFSVGGRTFSIPLENVMEITEVPEIFPLPLAPDYVHGVVHFRGGAMPVVNVGRVLNIEEEQTGVKQLIIVSCGSEKFGIAVHSMPNLDTDFPGETIDIQNFYETNKVAS